MWWTTLHFDIRRTSISRHFTKSGIFFFLRRKKKTMDNCCHNYVPYVCYVRIIVSVSHIAQNILHNCRHSSLATKRRMTKEKKFSKKKNSINHKSMREHESKKNLWNTRTLGAKTFRWSKDLEALVHDPVSDSLKPTLRQKGAPCSVHKSSVSRVKGSAREASINFIVYSLPSNFHASTIRNLCWVY